MVMGELFLHLKRNMEYELEKTVISLILKSGDTNKFLREDCHVALDHMVAINFLTIVMNLSNNKNIKLGTYY